MALIIAFSGVALASPPVPSPSETENLKITTTISCNGMVVKSEGLVLEIDSGDLLDNPPLASDKIYGSIGYDEKMMGLSGDTDFDKCFNVDTGTAPNLAVTKTIGYKSGDLGSLSHAEVVDMSLISSGSWVYVAAESSMSMTKVQATTETNVVITEAPVSLGYKITAEGKGSVSAGVDASVEEGAGKEMSYKDKSSAYGGNFTLQKKVDYTSKPSTSISTDIKSDKTVVEKEQFGWESGNRNLIHNEKMIGSNGSTEFEKRFDVSTSNLEVNKSIGYKSGDLGSLSHSEQVGMRYLSNTKCEEVNAYSEMVVTNVEATTETEVGITERSLHYETEASGNGTVSAGVDAFVEDGHGADTSASRMTYEDKSNAYGGNFLFGKKVDYKSKPP